LGSDPLDTTDSDRSPDEPDVEGEDEVDDRFNDDEGDDKEEDEGEAEPAIKAVMNAHAPLIHPIGMAWRTGFLQRISMTPSTNVVAVFDDASEATKTAKGLKADGFATAVMPQGDQTCVSVKADGCHAEVSTSLEDGGACSVQNVAR
jgi:hypothetical protein